MTLTGRAPRDQNRVPVTFGVSSADGETTLPIEVNPATGRLLVDSTGGGGGGGNVNIFDSLGNSLASTGGSLDVNITGGSSSGVQYTEGDATPATPTGTLPVFNNGGTISAVSNTVQLPVAIYPSGNDIPITISGDSVGLATEATLGAIDSNINTLTSTVQADGAPANSSLLQVGGVDGSANAQALSTNTSGHLNIADGGNSITVDGTVTANAGTNLNTSALALAATQTDKSQFTKLTDGTDTALITASGEQNVLATAQPGVDIGDVTINNASGASAVNIQDGGNSITVDGTVAATQSGTWTVQPGNTANTTAWKVDGSAVTQPVSYATTGSGTATGALRVELPTNGTGVIATVSAVTAITNALPAGTNAIGKLAANSGVDIGDVDVTSISAGTNNIGQVSVAPQTANGLSVFNATSSDGATALTNSAQAVKASAGQLYGWYIYNPNATAQFVQLYNTASASVTVGTTNPLFMLTIPATSGANVEFTNGITFSNAGWSAAATSTAGGNGAPGTALDAVFFYK